MRFLALASLECCGWQRAHCRATYGAVNDWYSATRSAEDAGNWGVSYEAYRDGFVGGVARELDLRAGDAVFESAVGAGWFLRGLRETLRIPLRLHGNDASEAAVGAARRALADGSFCVGDSLNLTWVAADAFDAVLCGYVETGGARDEAAATGEWVAQMAKRAKPGAPVFVGNVRPPRATDDAAAGLYLRPPEAAAAAADPVTPDWWRESAASDAFGWRCDPASVRVRPLEAPELVAAWGPRYSVFMRRRA